MVTWKLRIRQHTIPPKPCDDHGSLIQLADSSSCTYSIPGDGSLIFSSTRKCRSVAMVVVNLRVQLLECKLHRSVITNNIYPQTFASGRTINVRSHLQWSWANVPTLLNTNREEMEAEDWPRHRHRYQHGHLTDLRLLLGVGYPIFVN